MVYFKENRNEVLSEVISFSATKIQKDEIRRKSRKEHIHMSEYIRRILFPYKEDEE